MAIEASHSYSSSGASSPSGLVIPQPIWEIPNEDHTETRANGAIPFDVRQQLYLKVQDLSDEVLALNPRFELARYRPTKGKRYNRGWKWPAHWVSNDTLRDGSNLGGGGHYRDNGSPINDRPAHFPITSAVSKVAVPVGGWFKIGQIVLYDSTGNQIGQVNIPVQTGSKRTSGVYDHAPHDIPKYGGLQPYMIFAFRIAIDNPTSSNPLDRLTGPVSHPLRAQAARDGSNAFPIWPDGLGGAAGENSNTLVIRPANGSF